MGFFRQAACISLSRGDRRPIEKMSRRFWWMIGTLLTAGRRRSFLCDRLNSMRLCIWCHIIRLEFTEHDLSPKRHDLAVFESRKFQGRGFLFRKKDIPDTESEQLILKITGKPYRLTSPSKIRQRRGTDLPYPRIDTDIQLSDFIRLNGHNPR